MGCKFDKEIIYKYLDNTIDPLELIFLKEHIKVCVECKNELELMSKLDESLYGYFEGMEQNEALDAFSLSVLDKCYEVKKLTLKQRAQLAAEINRGIINNATRFTSYLPGSKLAGKAAKKAGQGMNKALKSCLNYGFKKLISSTVK